MNSKLNILTFNNHESYISSLAQSGHNFDVIVNYKNLALNWNPLAPPTPANVRLVNFDEAVKKKLKEGYYDLVVLHTAKSLLWLFPYFNQKFIFIAHIPLYFFNLKNTIKSFMKWLLLAVFRLTHRTKFVAVSAFKKRSWYQGGEVIDLCPLPFPQAVAVNYQSGKNIVVANRLLERGEELGANALMGLVKNNVPLMAIGNNPGFPGAVIPKSRDDFVSLFTQGRIYIFTIRQPWGDGYNTAMLEAMNIGMAIVTLKNPSSPIISGVNGLVVEKEEQLAEVVQKLASNPDEVKRLGLAAQETANRQFSLERFVSSWKRLMSSFAR